MNLQLSLAGALTGLLVGLTGVGGGALMTPMLLLLFGTSPVTAVATDLCFAVLTKLVGAGLHQLSGQVDWQVARRLWLGSLPAALVVVVAIGAGAHLPPTPWLTHAVGWVVLATALGLLAAPRLQGLARARRIADPRHFKAWQPLLTVVAGALMGVCVALTSIGAGALGSVLLLYLYPLRMHPHRLVATDLVHAIPLAATAGLAYLWAGRVDLAMLGSLLAGSLPAVVVGSLLAHRLQGRWLQRVLALVLLASAFKALLPAG